MVRGLEKFLEYFKGYEDNYIIIGGTACDIRYSEIGLDFRATNDIDMILVIEALSAEFISKLLDFVHEGQYEIRESTEKNRKYYRFAKPADSNFPKQLELFSRKPDFLDNNYSGHLAPIHVDNGPDSLSAILMDDEYYGFTIKTSNIAEKLNIASVEALIVLKAKAWLDMKARKDSGERIDTKQLMKHTNDVLFLADALTPEPLINLPAGIKFDLSKFINAISIDYKNDKSINSQLFSVRIRAIGEKFNLTMPGLNFNE